MRLSSQDLHLVMVLGLVTATTGSTKVDLGKLTHPVQTVTTLSSLAGKTFRIVTVQRLPFTKISKNKKKGETEITGILPEFFDSLKKKYNFSVDMFEEPDRKWGVPLRNGSWNGMIGMIIRKEADIASGVFSMLEKRYQVIDFSAPIHQESTAILIPPPTEGPKLTVIIKPLSSMVWLLLVINLILIMPIFLLIHVLKHKMENYERPQSTKAAASTGALFNFTIASLVQQGISYPLKRKNSMLVGIWWFSSLVVCNSYVAFLVGYLSVPVLFDLINKLEDLPKQQRLGWVFRSNTAHEILFNVKSDIKTYRDIGLGSERVDTDEEGTKKVLTGRYAFIKELSFVLSALSQDFDKSKTCRMTIAKTQFFSSATAFVLPKYSPYKGAIDFQIQNALATGLFNKWKQIHWPKSLFCADAAAYIIATKPKSRKLLIEDFEGAFCLLAFGFSLSIVSIIAEFVVAHIRDAKSQGKNLIAPFSYLR